MSTGTLDERATAVRAGGERAGRLRGLAWLVWRQNRALVWTLLGLVVVACGWLLYLHVNIVDATDAMRRTGCLRGGTAVGTARCMDPTSSLLGYDLQFTSRFQPLMAGLPLVVGMFVGPLVLAQEYERGTSRLVWSQSVSRGRWLAARIALPAGAVLLAVAAVAGTATWVWRADIFDGGVALDPVYGRLTYPALGVVPVAMALFGLALGTVVGMLLRRTLLSVGVTGALLVLAEFGLRAVRPYLYPMVHQVQHHAFRAGFFVTPNGAWVVSSGALTPDGRKVLVSQCYRDAACRAKPAFYGTYQPVSHVVPLQLVESGLLLVLAAGLVAFAFRQVRRSAA